MTRLLVAVLPLIVLLASCQASPPREAKPPVELTIMHPWFDLEELVFQRLVLEPFQSKHPHITVKLKQNRRTELAPDEETINALVGQNAPDLVVLDRLHVSQYAANDALAALNDYVKLANLESSEFYPALWEECTYEGISYCLPWEADSRLMLYNQTLMKEAGFDPEKPPATMEELVRMSEAITSYSGGILQKAGYLPLSTQPKDFLIHTLNFGGRWMEQGKLTPNHPNNVKALEWMVGLREKYDANAIRQLIAASGANISFHQGHTAFVFEQPMIAMIYASRSLPFEWDMAPVPTENGMPSTTVSEGLAAAIAEGSRYPNEAWELLQFITGTEASLLWFPERLSSYGMFSARPEVNEALKFSEKPHLAPFLEAMPTVSARPYLLTTRKEWEKLEQILGKALSQEARPQYLLDEWAQEASTVK